MNLSYKKIAENIMLVFKDKDKWKQTDLNKILEISKILKEEIAKTKRAEKYKENKAVKVEEIIGDEYILENDTTDIIHRTIYDMLEDNLNEELKQESKNILTDKVQTDLIRYYINIKSVATVREKTNFQLFVLPKIINTNQYGAVVSEYFSYAMYIDMLESNLQENMKKIMTHFNTDATYEIVTTYTLEYIPQQYQTIWRNKTTV